MKKTISVILTATVLAVIFLAIPAYAADDNGLSTKSVILPQFTFIWSMSAGLNIDSTGKATCSGSVVPASDTYTAYLTVSLQKSTSSGWSTIKSWTGSGYSGLIVEGYYYVTSGTYRVCSTAQIYSSTGALLETESFYSAVKTY